MSTSGWRISSSGSNEVRWFQPPPLDTLKLRASEGRAARARTLFTRKAGGAHWAKPNKYVEENLSDQAIKGVVVQVK